MSKKYIAIAGNIGSGKSSLVDFLCREYKLKPFFEPNDINPFLDDFYKDMKRWAFHSQIFFLAQRFRMHKELERVPEVVVQDRTIYEDAEVFCTNLFKSGLMEKRDYRTYMDMYNAFKEQLTPPTLMIYLECSRKSLRKRIARRGRKSEKSVPDEYIKKLEVLYKKWVKGYNLSPIITISTEKYDYLEDFISRQEIEKAIKKYL